MNPLRVCDVCEKSIKSFKDLRELQLIKRKDNDCIVEGVWFYELCMSCALSFEQDIFRKVKLKKLRKDV